MATTDVSHEPAPEQLSEAELEDITGGATVNTICCGGNCSA
jgi:hypothetical protein